MVFSIEQNLMSWFVYDDKRETQYSMICVSLLIVHCHLQALRLMEAKRACGMHWS